jgi:hypothetical protein
MKNTTFKFRRKRGIFPEIKNFRENPGTRENFFVKNHANFEQENHSKYSLAMAINRC